MDFTTILGITLGVTCILLGQVLEGGSVGSITQLTAAVIVLGGTAGAVIAQFPPQELKTALSQIPLALTNRSSRLEPLIARIVNLARLSRREGLRPLENAAMSEKDPFFAQALLALVDGNETHQLRSMLENQIDQEEQDAESGSKLFEAAGGYAPTIGILGAVLGLIHVMENLSDPSRLGEGISVAFVATVYGVGSANLIFLPIARKIDTKLARERRRKELIIEGVCAIQEGVNPGLIERRLGSFVVGRPDGRGKQTRGRPAKRG